MNIISSLRLTTTKPARSCLGHTWAWHLDRSKLLTATSGGGDIHRRAGVPHAGHLLVGCAAVRSIPARVLHRRRRRAWASACRRRRRQARVGQPDKSNTRRDVIIQAGRVAADGTGDSGIQNCPTQRTSSQPRHGLSPTGGQGRQGGTFEFGPEVGLSGGRGGSDHRTRRHVNGQFVATYGSGGGAGGYTGNGGGAAAARPSKLRRGKRGHSVRHQQRIYGGCRCGGTGGGVGVKGRGSTASGIIYNDGDAVETQTPALEEMASITAAVTAGPAARAATAR